MRGITSHAWGVILMRHLIEVRFFPGMLLALLGQLLVADCVLAFHNGACKQDVEKFCANVESGGGRLTTCMHENESMLSPSCRVETLIAWEQLSAFKAACGNDAAKLCGGVQSGHGRIYSCLKMNRGPVSAACVAKL